MSVSVFDLVIKGGSIPLSTPPELHCFLAAPIICSDKVEYTGPRMAIIA